MLLKNPDYGANYFDSERNSAICYFCNLKQLFFLPVPSFLHLWSVDNNSAYLVGLLLELHELM